MPRGRSTVAKMPPFLQAALLAMPAGYPRHPGKGSVMKHAHILIGLAVLALPATGAVAKPAYVATTVNLRAAPGTTSEIIAKIPGGSLVETKDCTEGWCEVTWQDKNGFAIQTALDMSGRVPGRAAGPGYPAPRGPYVEEEEPVYEGPPPPVYYYGGPY